VERETAVARKPVQDTQTAIVQELEDMTPADSAGATSRKAERNVDERLNAIGETLNDLAISNDQQEVENENDEQEDTELGKLSHDEPGWVIHRFSKEVDHRMQSIWQKEVRFDELTQLR
jgi:hypothetical protein